MDKWSFYSWFYLSTVSLSSSLPLRVRLWSLFIHPWNSAHYARLTQAFQREDNVPSKTWDLKSCTLLFEEKGQVWICAHSVTRGTRRHSRWGTTLQAGRSRVWDPLRWTIFFNLPNPPCLTRPRVLFSLQQKWVPETETKMFLGSEMRPPGEADSLIAVFEPIA
jgi:hypothetical protein